MGWQGRRRRRCWLVFSNSFGKETRLSCQKRGKYLTLKHHLTRTRSACDNKGLNRLYTTWMDTHSISPEFWIKIDLNRSSSDAKVVSLHNLNDYFKGESSLCWWEIIWNNNRMVWTMEIIMVSSEFMKQLIVLSRYIQPNITVVNPQSCLVQWMI